MTASSVMFMNVFHQQVQQILETTPGFDIVYDRGASVINDGVYVNDERQKFESDSGLSFPVIRTEYWERELSQAQKDRERKQTIQRDVHMVRIKTCQGQSATKPL